MDEGAGSGSGPAYAVRSAPTGVGNRSSERLPVLTFARFEHILRCLDPVPAEDAHLVLGPVQVVELAALVADLGAAPLEVPAGCYTVRALYQRHLASVVEHAFRPPASGTRP